jgi:hypothetical protein
MICDYCGTTLNREEEKEMKSLPDYAPIICANCYEKEYGE